METNSLLSAYETGEGISVLIIHGWEMSGKVEQLDFEPIFANTPGFRRIYVDLPGMGSTPANNVKDLDDIYHRLVQFIDSRLGKGNFMLAGSSCGGYLARALARKYGDQINGLLLRVPLVEPQDNLRDLDLFQPLVAKDEVMSSLTTEYKALLGNVLVQTWSYVEALKYKFSHAYVPATQAADKEVLGPIRADPKRYSLSVPLEDPTSKLMAPTLIICGRQDTQVGYRDSLRLLEYYPRSTFAVLDRAGHDLPVEDHGVFKVLVDDWLHRSIEWRSW